jgi:integrase
MPTTKLFKNGNRWWLRLNHPSGDRPKLSTGTSELVLATRIATMVDELLEDRKSRHWIDLLASGDLSLATLYDRRARGQLEALAAELEESEDDLEPLVATWIAKMQKRSLAEGTKSDYERQLRALIPEGKRFPASDFTEDVISELLDELTDRRTGEPLTGSTKRRYLAPLRLFYRYARKQIPTLVSPFDDPDWIPANNPSRMKYWSHAQVKTVLELMDDQAFVAMTLLFGTGIELGALLAMTHGDICGQRSVTARGTKNNARRNRSVRVDAWAWDVVEIYTRTARAGGASLHEKLFDFASDGGDLRDAFYAAQVEAGLIPEPPRSKNGKKLWSQVDVHTLHDCRHSYCYTRLLGDDGEPRQSLKFCAHQLGHTTEQMVMQIYGKANIEERIKQLELQEAFTAGQLAQRPSEGDTK